MDGEVQTGEGRATRGLRPHGADPGQMGTQRPNGLQPPPAAPRAKDRPLSPSGPTWPLVGAPRACMRAGGRWPARRQPKEGDPHPTGRLVGPPPVPTQRGRRPCADERRSECTTAPRNPTLAAALRPGPWAGRDHPGAWQPPCRGVLGVPGCGGGEAAATGKAPISAQCDLSGESKYPRRVGSSARGAPPPSTPLFTSTRLMRLQLGRRVPGTWPLA